MGKALRAASIVPQDFAGARAAGALDGDLQELVPELLLGELGALQAGARLDDLLDIQVEDVPTPQLALGALTPPQEHPQSTSALLERELDLLADLVVVGDRFLRLAGERHPDRRHVDE